MVRVFGERTTGQESILFNPIQYLCKAATQNTKNTYLKYNNGRKEKQNYSTFFFLIDVSDMEKEYEVQPNFYLHSFYLFASFFYCSFSFLSRSSSIQR